MNPSFNLETFYNTNTEKRAFMPAKFFSGIDYKQTLKFLISDNKTTVVFADQFLRNDELFKAITNQGIKVYWVEAEPRTSLIDKVLAENPEVVDQIICVGGGSTMDAGKAFLAVQYFGTYLGVGYGANIAMLPKIEKKSKLICFPTTAGTGAEGSRYYILYDATTKHKILGRSWSFVADEIYLDPKFLIKMPTSLLVSCAFDAFVHLFETYICKFENSYYNTMLSVHGISTIIKSLEKIVVNKSTDIEEFGKIQWASALGGIAISNARTGNIHESAGVLLEETNLSHPETLFIFFRKAIEQYQDAIASKEDELFSGLHKQGITSLSDLIVWWERIFELSGIVKIIQTKMDLAKDKQQIVISRSVDRVLADKVWCNKEGPIALNEKLVRELLVESLSNWGWK